ncbi:MAG: molybdenum cofactor biosynthesis protein MoaE [Pseudomonadota bacterium]
MSETRQDVRVGPEPFDPSVEAEALRLAGGDAGALVTFTGLVRAEGASVDGLELRHHPTFTLREIERLTGAVAARWSLTALRVVHRVGVMRPGEAIVFVGAASAHRRDAFEAADCLMDDLKTRAPFWKREHGPDGVRWVEPRAEDYADAGRWAGAA